MTITTSASHSPTLLQRVSSVCTHVVQRYLPDPFLFAAILTFVVFLITMPVTGQSPLQVVDAFAGGFWNLLAFAMQMAMVVVTGHAMLRRRSLSVSWLSWPVTPPAQHKPL